MNISVLMPSTLGATERKMHLLNNYSCPPKLPPALSSWFSQGKSVFSLYSYRPSGFRISTCGHKETLKSIHTTKIHNTLSLCCWAKVFLPRYFDGSQQSSFAHQSLTSICQVLKNKHGWGQKLFSRGSLIFCSSLTVSYIHC